MPTSEHWQIPRVVDVLVRERPRTVLDVGAGYGKDGLLAREFGGAERVDAVAAVAPRFPVYDRVWLGDLRALESLLPAEPVGPGGGRLRDASGEVFVSDSHRGSSRVAW